MLGAIVGDLIGSVYTEANVRDENFELIVKESHFTQNSILTFAVAKSFLYKTTITECLIGLYQSYPEYEYKTEFVKWVNSGGKVPQFSSTNEAAMFIGPTGWLLNSFESVMTRSKNYSELTHSHPDAVKGAQAIGLATYLCRSGISKDDLIEVLERKFRYNLNYSMKDLQENYHYDPDCEKSLPQIIYTFLASENFVDSIRKAVSIGGDSSTVSVINGTLAEAFYKEIPEILRQEAFSRMDSVLRDLYSRFRVFESDLLS